MEEKFFITIVTMSLWDEPHRGRHHYAVALSKKHRVLWVNRSLTWREKKEAKIGIEKITDNLHVLHTGRNMIPGRIENRINLNNRRRLRLLLKEIAHYDTPDVVWIYDYKALQFVERFKGKATILYFCNDYFGEFAYRSYESKLAAKVDFVFATAPKLVDRLKPFNPNCAFLPHGVWPSDIRPEFKKKAEPESVGYVGTLRSVVDAQFLRKIISDTNFNLILAGPIIECDRKKRTEFEELFRHDRVIYLGNLDQTQIKYAINKIDICLLPYIITFKTQHNSPIKINDYLAEGKPIVATPYFDWPEPYKQFVNIYNNQQCLDTFLREVYFKWSRKKHMDSVDLANNSTWDQRVKQVGRIIGISL
jgi:teichuronic acid biosynthesis glycosyltransferase TuaH